MPVSASGGHTPSDPAGLAAPDAGRWAPELAFALDLARQAGEILVDLQGRLVAIEHKSETDVVTEADHASEALVLEAVGRRFPGDAVLSEEIGHVAAADAAPPNGRTWVVDPLDGTVNYANGLPLYCVSIALVVDGRPVVGVVRDPVRGEDFAATEDGPAMVGGAPIRLHVKDRLRDCIVSLGLSGERSPERWMRIRHAIRVPRGFGSAALSLAYVANGRFDAFIQESNLSAWDVAAAGLIAERAGITVTDIEGGPWFDLRAPSASLSAVAAPQPHHARLMELLAD
jgi:myo-inositol-1(or 4)-monophosphatase